MEAIYRIAIENGLKKIEIESHDKEWLEKQKKELFKALNIFEAEAHQIHAKSIKDKGVQTTPTERAPLPRMTENEFYRKYCAILKSNIDIAVYLIYYMSWVEKKKTVTTTDVKDLFIRVGIPNANKLNYTNMLTRAKNRALLNFINNSWSLTITGEDYVVNKIQGAKNE